MESVYWSGRLRRLSPYIPGEQPRDRQFIKLNTNENPYPPSPRVFEAINRAAGETIRLYPDPSCLELRETIAARYGVKPSQVFAGNGSDEILAFAFAAFFPGASAPAGTIALGTTATAGTAAPTGTMSATGTLSTTDATEILFPDITYSFYPVYADLWAVPCKTVPLDGDFVIHPEDYRIPNGGIIFPNPNAPTGRVLDTAAILSLAEWQERQGRVLIVDEAYIAFGGRTLIPHISTHPNLLLIHTLSKSASLAGLRVGFAVAQEELIEGLCRVRDSFNSYTLDRLAQAAAAAAVADAPYYEGLARRIIATRARVTVELENRGITVIPSLANFLFIRFPGLSGAAAAAALREQGILVRHFNRDRIADFLRVSIGTDEEMDMFLQECKKIVGVCL
ncbi:MAG: aminotransferase class I/II-fold pyridoxal phosphate-dependent enzyme [Treponema sp.]|jgi:histidinol-phosphate aminotransferase|nr:aminotransferase class I/II-fold pyridoxal phosphate-dependent enzyme [Treponema sp.]